jgi:hypothetical protein
MRVIRLLQRFLPGDEKRHVETHLPLRELSEDERQLVETHLLEYGELLRRFLLGQLTENETEDVEKRLLEDDLLFELCKMIETELLDACARGELAPAERDRVLRRLASSPQGRARLALALDLASLAAGKLSPEPLPPPLPFRRRVSTLTTRPAVRWAIAAGLAAIIIGGIGNLVEPPVVPDTEEDISPQPDLPPKENNHPTPTPAPSIQNSDKEKTPQPPPTLPPSQDRAPIVRNTEHEEPVRDGTVDVKLDSLVVRSEERLPEMKLVRIPVETAHVKFHMDVTEVAYETYGATVKDGNEKVVWSDNNLNSEPMAEGPGSILVFALPVDKLPSGRYEVEVHGNSAEGDQVPLITQEIEVASGG